MVSRTGGVALLRDIWLFAEGSDEDLDVLVTLAVGANPISGGRRLGA